MSSWFSSAPAAPAAATSGPPGPDRDALLRALRDALGNVVEITHVGSLLDERSPQVMQLLAALEATFLSGQRPSATHSCPFWTFLSSMEWPKPHSGSGGSAGLPPSELDSLGATSAVAAGSELPPSAPAPATAAGGAVAAPHAAVAVAERRATPGEAIEAVARAVHVRTDTGRARAWLRAALNLRLLPATTARMTAPRYAAALMAAYDGEAVLRDREAAERLVTLLEMTLGLPFALEADVPTLDDTPDAATTAAAARLAYALAASDTIARPSLARGASTGTGAGTGTGAPGETDAAADAAAMVPPAVVGKSPAITSSTTPEVAPAPAPNPTPTPQSSSSARAPPRPREWSFSLSLEGALGSVASAVDRATSMIVDRLVAVPEATPSGAATTAAAPAPSASASASASGVPTIGGPLSSLLTLGLGRSRPVASSQAGSSRRGSLSNGSGPGHGHAGSTCFGVPLTALALDPHHCVHAMLDHRLSVPELVHRCARFLQQPQPQQQSSSGESQAAVWMCPGLGVVQPEPGRVLELVKAYDATGTLPVPSAAAATTPGAPPPPPQPADYYAVAGVLAYFLARLPDPPIPYDRYDTAVALASLPHADGAYAGVTVVETAGAGAAAKDSDAKPRSTTAIMNSPYNSEAGAAASPPHAAAPSPRLRNLRALINDLPNEHKQLLCEIVPLYAWMATSAVPAAKAPNKKPASPATRGAQAPNVASAASMPAAADAARWKAAAALAAVAEGTSQQYCYDALTAQKDDANAAAAWILENPDRRKEIESVPVSPKPTLDTIERDAAINRLPGDREVFTQVKEDEALAATASRDVQYESLPSSAAAASAPTPQSANATPVSPIDLSPDLILEVDSLARVIGPALLRPPALKVGVAAMKPGGAVDPGTGAGTVEIVSAALRIAEAVAPPLLDNIAQVVSCLLLHWRFVLRDALEERREWQRGLVAKMHTLTDTHRALYAIVDPVKYPAHEALFRRLWTAVLPAIQNATQVDTTEFAMNSTLWRAIGFQRSAPVAECRASGLLGVLCLVYLAETFQHRVLAIIARLHGAREVSEAFRTEPAAGTGVSPNPVQKKTSSKSLAVGTPASASMQEAEDEDGMLVVSGSSSTDAGENEAWYPFAYTAVVIARKLAEALHLVGAKATTPPASSRAGGAATPVPATSVPLPVVDPTPRTGANIPRVFSPLVVATTIPDFWTLASADKRHLSVASSALPASSGKAPPPASLEHGYSISTAFARLFCLAVFITDARWVAGPPALDQLPGLVSRAIADVLAMLPELAAASGASSFLVSSSSHNLDVLTALGQWRRRTAVGLSDRVLDVIAANAAKNTHNVPGLRATGAAAVFAHPHTAAAAAAPAAAPAKGREAIRGRAASTDAATVDGHDGKDKPHMAHARSATTASTSTTDSSSASSTPAASTSLSGVIPLHELRRMPLSELHQPVLAQRSAILTPHQAALLEAVLPRGLRDMEWSLAYSLALHGASVDTLLVRAREHQHSLLVLKDAAGAVFGGFAAEPWAVHKGGAGGSFYGSGQSFVFTFEDRRAYDAKREADLDAERRAEQAAMLAVLHPHGHGEHAEPAPAPAPAAPTVDDAAPIAQHFSVYRWAHRNKYFQLATPDGLGMGGGGHFAFYVDGELSSGSSGNCATFLSPVLSKTEHFQCILLELWVFNRRTVVW